MLSIQFVDSQVQNRKMFRSCLLDVKFVDQPRMVTPDMGKRISAAAACHSEWFRDGGRKQLNRWILKKGSCVRTAPGSSCTHRSKLSESFDIPRTWVGERASRFRARP